MRAARAVCAFLLLLVAGGGFAASQDERRAHGAHEHGHGTLDIVVEGEELVVELRIPAVNVVGFEHAPRDDAYELDVRVVTPAAQTAVELHPGETVVEIAP